MLTLLLLAALPADPHEALRALEGYGATPACEFDESIEAYTGPPPTIDLGNGPVPMRPPAHVHTIKAPALLPALRGKSSAIIPFLEHRSQVVVHRAATLLCFVRDAPAKAALVKVAARHRCLAWLQRIALLVSGVDEAAACEPGAEPSGYDAFGQGKPAPQRSAAALELAARISKGEAAALHQALQDGVAMAVSDRQDAYDALRAISAPAGLALLVQASQASWENDLLEPVVGVPLLTSRWEREAFNQNTFEPAVENTAVRLHVSPGEVLVRVFGLLPPALQRDFRHFLESDRNLLLALGRYARSPAAATVTEPLARELLQQVRRQTDGADPLENDAESRRISSLRKAEDLVALREVATQARNPFHQLLAACALLHLGDSEFALPLLEQKPAPMGLLDMNAIRAEVKALRDAATPGPARDRLEKAFAVWNAHCAQNDCSRESPR
jgi:hypothetical protein